MAAWDKLGGDRGGGGSGSALLALLAAQFALQPLLTKHCVTPGTSTSSLVLGQEVAKILGCAAALSRDAVAGREALRIWTLRGCLLAAGLPSATYLVQNYCIQVAYQRLDAVAFNVLNQTKLIFTALFSWLISRKTQSAVQCFALALVTLGGVLVSLGSAAGGESPSSSSETEQEGRGSSNLGVLCAVAAAALSGLSSGIVEWALQKQRRNNYVFTIELASLGCIILVASLLFNLTADAQRLRVEGLFAHWRLLTLVPVVIQGLSGILIAWITKLRGGVEKVLATIVGLLLTCILQQLVTGSLPPTAVCRAVPLVAAGLWLYARSPTGRPRRVSDDFGPAKVV